MESVARLRQIIVQILLNFYCIILTFLDHCMHLLPLARYARGTFVTTFRPFLQRPYCFPLSAIAGGGQFKTVYNLSGVHFFSGCILGTKTGPKRRY